MNNVEQDKKSSPDYAFVEAMVSKADVVLGGAPLWYGWALRDAFNAGVKSVLTDNPPAAYLVDGREEQGLFFDKGSAEKMADANSGYVLALFTDIQPARTALLESRLAVLQSLIDAKNATLSAIAKVNYPSATCGEMAEKALALGSQLAEFGKENYCRPSGLFKREVRYVVFKASDCERLSPEGKVLLTVVSNEISELRLAVGKPELDCVVVESDWPEYELVWHMIQARVEGFTAPVDNGKSHNWDGDGERCLDCGDKDWFASKYCTGKKLKNNNDLAKKDSNE